jgi:hypothetical protein
VRRSVHREWVRTAGWLEETRQGVVFVFRVEETGAVVGGEGVGAVVGERVGRRRKRAAVRSDVGASCRVGRLWYSVSSCPPRRERGEITHLCLRLGLLLFRGDSGWRVGVLDEWPEEGRAVWRHDLRKGRRAVVGVGFT